MSEDFLSDVKTIKEISSGGYAMVYEICKGKYDKDTRTCNGELYAEKVYTEGEPEFNEIDVLSRFDHPNLLKAIKSHVDSNGNFHLILPLADKPNYDLKKVIEKGKLSIDKAIIYIYQIISAVGFLHSQEYYHCDIKPQNILMFNDNCVLADYGFTYHNSYNIETCGTVGYSSPQAWSENENFNWVYYKEKINQVQSDIYSIGAVFYECLLGKQLNDYTLYKKDSYEANNDEAYQQTEERILKVINFMKENKRTMEELAFDCIYKMCRNSQEDRYKSINEVLQHPLFVSRTMTRIIPGKIKATKMPDYNVCKSLIGPSLTVEKAMKENERFFVIMRKNQPYSLLTHITLYTLLYRTIYLAKKQSEFTLVVIACLYLTIGVFKPVDFTYFDINATRYKSEDIRNMVYKIVDELEGIIRVPSIYEETDNALEIIWWLINVSKDCNYLLKSPKELHSMYAEIETKKPELISSRINKNSILAVSHTYNYEYKLEYKIEDETKVIGIDENYFL